MLIASAWAVAALIPGLAIAAANTETPPANAIMVGDWTFVGNSDTTVMFIKPVPGEGPYRRVYVRFEDGKPFTRDDFSSLASLELDDIDCVGQRTRIVESVRYALHNMAGATHTDTVDSDWKMESPGSFGAGILAKACAAGQ